MRAALFVALCLLAGCGSDPTPAPQTEVGVPTSGPDERNVLGGELPSYGTRVLSNPYVEVSRFALPPDSSVSLRNGKNWMVYALSGASVRVGEEAQAWARGSAEFYDEATRIVNAGTAPAELLFVERWENPLPDRPEVEDLRFPAELTRLDQIDSDAIEVLVANEHAVAARVSLAPGEVLPTHSAFSRIVYALSDYTVERYNSEAFAGTTADGTFTRAAGAIVWDSALNYGARNAGGQTVEALIVAYYD